MFYLASDHKLHFAFNASTTIFATSTTTVDDGQWHFAVGTVDTSTSQGRLAIYIDGAMQGAPTTFGTNVYMYGGYWPLNDAGSQPFTGPFPARGGGGNPCDAANVAPYFSNVCSAVCAGRTVTSWVAAGTEQLAAVTSGNNTLTIAVARSGFYTPYDHGLTLLIPVQVSQSPWKQTFTWADNRILFN